MLYCGGMLGSLFWEVGRMLELSLEEGQGGWVRPFCGGEDGWAFIGRGQSAWFLFLGGGSSLGFFFF